MNRVTIILATAFTLVGLAGAANADIYSETIELNEDLHAWFGALSSPFAYEHHNPFEMPVDQGGGGYTPEEYFQAVDDGLITAVDLTLDFGGLGTREWVMVEVNPIGGDWTRLGWVYNNTPRTFHLQDYFGPTGGIDGLPVEIRLYGFDGSGFLGLGAEAMLENSTLSVSTGAMPETGHAPVPGAVLLGAVGLGFVGLSRVRRKKHR